MARTPDYNDPDAQNAEQRDEGQAQDVAQDALDIRADRSEDSERGGTDDPSDLIPQDTPDLVEKMNEMVTSGRLDNDAFAGEPMLDDEEDILGQTDDDEDEESLEAIDEGAAADGSDDIDLDE